MKGTYILLMSMPERRRIKVGRLVSMVFKKGYYAYVGSAMNGLDARIIRHLRTEKKLYWHIDYLLQNVDIDNLYCSFSNKKQECKFAQELCQDLEPAIDFGSSDCNCKGHLFHSKRYDAMQRAIAKLGVKEYKKRLEKLSGIKDERRVG